MKSPTGLIQKSISLEHFDLTLLSPSKDLEAFVENYWVITWDLTGKQPYTQENLPHPSQHMVIDPQGKTGIFGVPLTRFNYKLESAGRIFGTKFWPGAFSCFMTNPITTITDKNVSIDSIFDCNDRELEDELLNIHATALMASKVEELLRTKQPSLSEQATLARTIIKAIETDKSLTSTTELASLFQLTTRSLQRLFERYIGASPKWVVERYRMIEAVETLNNKESVDLTELAHSLGYFDQAHFSKAFSALIGYPPSHYYPEAITPNKRNSQF